jgi:hypothetical protein
LTLIITKTKVVVFRAGGRLSHLDKWTYNGTLLEIVSCFTYLGVLFSYTSSFSKTQQALARQGRKALFCMRKIVSQFNGLSPIVVCDLFDKLILPILSYGCEVWGFYPSDAIEHVHRDFMRSILKVKSTVLNEFVYGELGRMPLINLRYCRIVKYWLKILKSTEQRIIKQVYIAQKLHMESNDTIVNWVSLLRDLLYRNGFGYVWLNQGVENEELFLVVFKQRIKDSYSQNWHVDIMNSRKAVTYKTFVFDVKPQLYLSCINVVQYRVALTQFRVRSNHLHVETGSWHRDTVIPYHERYCTLCNLHVIEDEYHFLLVCPNYINLREQYIARYYRVRPNMLKFVTFIMSSSNVRVLKRLSIFLHKAFLKRKTDVFVN